MEKLLTPWTSTENGVAYRWTVKSPYGYGLPVVSITYRLDTAGVGLEFFVYRRDVPADIGILTATDFSNAKKYVDNKLSEDGWLLLTDEQWDKMKTLL